MKKVVSSLLALSIMGVSGLALADNTSKETKPVASSSTRNPYPFKVGGQVEIGTPFGAAVGLEARLPYVPWFKLGADFTYSLAPGAKVDLVVDPIKFCIAPVADFEMGHQWPLTVPNVSNSPKIDFDYANLMGGLGIGSRDHFRFMILGGMSYMNGTVGNFQGVLKSSKDLSISDPHFNGWVPTVKLAAHFLF